MCAGYGLFAYINIWLFACLLKGLSRFMSEHERDKNSKLWRRIKRITFRCGHRPSMNYTKHSMVSFYVFSFLSLSFALAFVFPLSILPHGKIAFHNHPNNKNTETAYRLVSLSAVLLCFAACAGICALYGSLQVWINRTHTYIQFNMIIRTRTVDTHRDRNETC